MRSSQERILPVSRYQYWDSAFASLSCIVYISKFTMESIVVEFGVGPIIWAESMLRTRVH